MYRNRSKSHPEVDGSSGRCRLEVVRFWWWAVCSSVAPTWPGRLGQTRTEWFPVCLAHFFLFFFSLIFFFSFFHFFLFLSFSFFFDFFFFKLPPLEPSSYSPAERNLRLSANRPNALPLGQTGSRTITLKPEKPHSYLFIAQCRGREKSGHWQALETQPTHIARDKCCLVLMVTGQTVIQPLWRYKAVLRSALLVFRYPSTTHAIWPCS